MTNKLDYCKRILTTYSLLVDFDGEPRRENVPADLDVEETYKSWKKRVLGDEVENVVVFQATEPRGNVLISTLQDNSQAEHMGDMIRYISREKKKKLKIAVNQAVDETVQNFKFFSAKTLKNLIEENEDQLEDSVVEFFSRYFEDQNKEIDALDLLEDLLFAYDGAVKFKDRK